MRAFEYSEADRQGLSQALTVARTGVRSPASDGDEKLLLFFPRHGECDARIAGPVIEVRFSWLKKQKPSTYFGSLAPGLVSQLMDLGGIQTVNEEVEFSVGPGSTGTDLYQDAAKLSCDFHQRALSRAFDRGDQGGMAMRGRRDGQGRMFFTINVEQRIAANHPLRQIKLRVDRILASMSEVFDRAYSKTGRPSVPPERLLKAMLLQAIYSIRSEEQLVQRIDTDLLFRWFLGMDPAEEVFDPTAFTHNRERLREHAIVSTFFDAVLNEALEAELCSDHFSVDGTLLESYASTKSFQPKVTSESVSAKTSDSPEDNTPRDPPAAPPTGSNSFKSRNPEIDFHGQKRSNETHASRTDTEAKLYRKGNGQPSILAHMGHVLSENRHGLIMQVQVTPASGTAEREATLTMLDRYESTHGHRPKTIDADKGYDSGEFLQTLESRQIEPHIAIRDVKRDHEPRPPHQQAAHQARVRMQARRAETGYQLSQRCRKKVEECFGWFKTIAGLDKLRHVGQWKIQQQLELAGAAFNLVRLRKLAPLT